MKKVLIWGTGYHAQRMLLEDVFKECDIIGFIDTYKKQDVFNGYPVIIPKDIFTQVFDHIIISTEDPTEIIKSCQQLNIDESKLIVIYNHTYPNSCHIAQNDELIKKEMPSVYNQIQLQKEYYAKTLTSYLCDLDEIDTNQLVGTYEFSGDYIREYTRYRTFELVANELKKYKNQNWCVAELGVFRGKFSRLINAHFKDKKLYMLDTFEGFGKNEALEELSRGHCDSEFIEYFSQTNEELVLSMMLYKENCIICKGLFPATASLLENEQFGFVSLDVDFKESTLSGLEFFYPRMIDGGYIFIHDYNSISLKGVSQAVSEFEGKYNINLKKLPLCDKNGTLVIIK